MNTPNYTPPKVADLIADACAVFDVDPAKLTSSSRTPEVAYVRNIICYIGFFFTRESLKSIGAQLGNRDYSTVIYGRNMVIGYLGMQDSKFIEKWNVYTKSSQQYHRLVKVRHLNRSSCE